MIRYLSLAEVLDLHDRIISQTGGSHGLRDLGMLESVLSQPKTTFGSRDLYAGLVKKASALGFSLVKNHPFVDGNKRLGVAGHDCPETRNLTEGMNDGCCERRDA